MVAFALVCVGFCERCDRLVECVAAPEIPADQRRRAGARMGATPKSDSVPSGITGGADPPSLLLANL